MEIGKYRTPICCFQKQLIPSLIAGGFYRQHVIVIVNFVAITDAVY